MAERLAIIGGDAAGMSAASQARRRRPDLDVVAFERGPYTSYSACGIPYYVGGEVDDADDLIVRTPEQHRERGIDVRTGCEVVAVDLGARRLTVRDGDGREGDEPFDQLILATGAVAKPPPVPGAELVEPARTVDAAERFTAALREGGRNAVVIGAGYIGLEMAEALVRRGLQVTMIDLADQVMNIALDADMAAHVQRGAESEGIDVRTGCPLEAIEAGPDGRPAVVHAGGERFDADHVVLATGVKPATAIAEAAGLEVGEFGGLLVDDRQRCAGHDGVFAAGDCVESWHRVLERPVNVQLGTHANKQGRIAGINATGGNAAFPGVVGTAVSRICSREIGRTGLTEREARELTDLDVVAATVEASTRAGYYPGSGPIWVKLVCEVESGRVVGGQLVGVEGAAKRVDVVATAVWTGLTVDELELLDLGYAPPVAPVYDPVLVAASALARTRRERLAGTAR
jgi:NADPH-dependent 2,4-dienoyl-CoA reductase/sulfur reductase-like enzyme